MQHTKRQVSEWAFKSGRTYDSPFADVQVDAVFTAPSGATHVMPAFYDGGGTWKLRFNPGEAGAWTARLQSRPVNDDLSGDFAFEVADGDGRGFLAATPGRAWGFHFENGEPVFIMGDTTYDLFGMAYCGGDVEGFLARRRRQGFNLLRTRLTSSYFHPPNAEFEWQDRRMWPWGGSSTMPRFDRFNLDWFASVDRTVAMIERSGGIGLEMIMEAWGFEFPFNHRSVFTAEWEALWMRYLIARYDAYNCVWFWTPLNEYEYYPNGDWHWTETADRWALRIGRWIKATAPHGHILSMHNGPTLPPFAERFKADPQAVDSIMFQEWGARDKDNAWLATGIEASIAASLDGWHGSAVFAEWGYERDPAYESKFPSHEYCCRNHTRRGAWRGVFSGLGIIAGFEHTWGPWMDLQNDQPGVADLAVLNDFMRKDDRFAALRPAPNLVKGDFAPGHRPLALNDAAGDRTLVYFPAGGAARIDAGGSVRWFDPRDGALQPGVGGGPITAPEGRDDAGRPLDFIAVIDR